MSGKTIKVDYMARVEGEGSLLIQFAGKEVKTVQLKIFEPPRFFEALLRGRAQEEAPDITARICGICPVAYLMSSCHALENLLGIKVEGQLRALRRLLYCGEWLESHLLHIFMLHAPDFLGYPDSLTLAKDHPGIVKNALRMKKIGNQIVSVVGGREIHPINIRIGGFYRVPTQNELRALLPDIQWASQTAQESLLWLATLPIPEAERPYEFVAMRHPNEYPLCEGRLISNKGLDIDVHQYDETFVEEQVPYSNALQSKRVGGGTYFCGPLARFNLNFDRLHPVAKRAAKQIKFEPPSYNPFQSILARMVEVIHVYEEAIEIINAYTPPSEPFVSYQPKAGTGYGCTEAPRGILYHRYTTDEQGTILDAKIVAPTSQNQGTIEEDLRFLAPQLIELPHKKATLLAEQAVRNYDPCISCATHFLTLKCEEVLE